MFQRDTQKAKGKIIFQVAQGQISFRFCPILLNFEVVINVQVAFLIVIYKLKQENLVSSYYLLYSSIQPFKFDRMCYLGSCCIGSPDEHATRGAFFFQ